MLCHVITACHSMQRGRHYCYVMGEEGDHDSKKIDDAAWVLRIVIDGLD